MKKPKILDYLGTESDFSSSYFIGYLKGFLLTHKTISVKEWNEAMESSKKFAEEWREKNENL